MQNHPHESSADLQRYLRSLGELLPASVFAKDLEGRYVYVNARFARSAELTGPEDALGKLPRQILDPKRARQAEAEDLRVLRKGQSIINQENFDRRSGSEDRWNLVSKIPVRSADGSVVGMVGMAMDINDRKLAEQAVQSLADELKAQNARLEQDLELARKIQSSLNQSNTAPHPSDKVELAYQVRQCEHLGGDLVKVARTEDGDCVVFVCDVMGHGVQAALVASLLAGQIDRIGEDFTDPGSYLSELNARFTSSTRQFSELMLTTALCLRYRPSRGDCDFASAGHPLPLLYRAASGSAARASHHAGQGQGALGLLKDYTYRSDTIALDPGDIVLLHSDGISESTTPSGQQLGIDWICRHLAKEAKQPAAQIVASLLEALDQETAGALDDDVTALALRPAGLV